MFLPLVFEADPDCPGLSGWWIYLLIGTWDDGTDRIVGAWWIDGKVED